MDVGWPARRWFRSLKDLEHGRTFSIPRLRYRFLSQALRHLPLAVTTRFNLDRSLPLRGREARWAIDEASEADTHGQPPS